MPQKNDNIIVYRSQGERDADQFFYENGGTIAFFGGAAFVILVLIMAVYAIWRDKR